LKRALIFTGIGALLVGLAFLVGRANVPDPATEPYFGKRSASRAKAAGLELHFSRAGIEQKLGPASVLRAGDSLRIVVRGERARYVEVRLRDGGADPTTVFPAGAAESALVQPRETLPVRPTLGAGGARVLVTALFSDRARPIGATADDDTEVVTLAIAKE
jgi:hypothetical protein